MRFFAVQRVLMVPTVTNKIRLNLGARDKAIPGFIGIDCDPHAGIGEVGDIADLSQYADGSVAEIYASHCLEHFPHRRTLDVLLEWNRVLAKGGILYLAVPDFERTVELYQKIGLDDWVQNYVCGDQGYRTAFHYAIFDFKRLHSILMKAGFSEASRVKSFGFLKNDCSELLSNVDFKQISLNVMAVK